MPMLPAPPPARRSCSRHPPTRPPPADCAAVIGVVLPLLLEQGLASNVVEVGAKRLVTCNQMQRLPRFAGPTMQLLGFGLRVHVDVYIGTCMLLLDRGLAARQVYARVHARTHA